MGAPSKQPSILLVVSMDAVGVARLPWIFHRVGYRVTVLTRTGVAVLRSRFVDAKITVQGGPKEVAAALAAGIGEYSRTYDWILPCDEPLLVAISERPDRGDIAALMPFLPPPDRLDEVLSKLAFLKRAASLGLPVPEFRLCSSSAEAKAAASAIGYPVVLKLAQSMAGSGVRLIQDPATMERELAHVNDPEFMVQKCVDGRVGGSTLLMERGVPIRHFSFYKLFNWPGPFSPSGGGELKEDPQIDALVDQVGRMENFHGLCSIDWLEERGTGKIYLIEFNPRYTPTTYVSGWAGSDFLPALSGMHQRVGPPVTPVRPSGHGGKIFQMFPESAFRAIDDKDVPMFIRSLGSAPWNDPGLFLAEIWRLVGHYVPASWKKLLPRTHRSRLI